MTLLVRLTTEDFHAELRRKSARPITALTIAQWLHEWYTAPFAADGAALREQLQLPNDDLAEHSKIDLLFRHMSKRRRARPCDVYAPSYQAADLEWLAIHLLDDHARDYTLAHWHE